MTARSLERAQEAFEERGVSAVHEPKVHEPLRLIAPKGKVQDPVQFRPEQAEVHGSEAVGRGVAPHLAWTLDDPIELRRRDRPVRQRIW